MKTLKVYPSYKNRSSFMDLPILFKFDVPQCGWELDNIGYVVQYNNSPTLIFTDHNIAYLDHGEDINDVIRNLENVIVEMKKARDMVMASSPNSGGE